MRLIDADALLDEYCGDCNNTARQICGDDPICGTAMMVKDAPTVEDAVVVVRCKNCGHGKPIDTTQSPFRYYKPECIICYCEEVIGDEPMVYPPDHFCGYGERKSDNE